MSDRRAYLVTGAASGIGRAIAARLSDDGHDVLSVDRAPDPDGPGRPFAADLTRREDNHAAVTAALAAFNRLDGVVACAGFQVVAPVQEAPDNAFGYPPDTFWPHSTAAFLVVGVILTFASAQLVAPTRRSRLLRRPHLRLRRRAGRPVQPVPAAEPITLVDVPGVITETPPMEDPAA